MLDNLKLTLANEPFPYRIENDSLIVELPNGFGELDISDLNENDDDILGLVGEDWHTHSSCLENEELSPAQRVNEFIKDIYSGKYLLIKEKVVGKKPIKTIVDDLESYENYLPKGATYEVFNKCHVKQDNE